MNVSRMLYVQLSAIFFVVLAIYGYNVARWGLWREETPHPWHVPAADAERGKELVQSYGCIGCHTIPGIPAATGKVGPRLDRFQERVYIAGVIPNSGQNLAHWIRFPQQVSPESAMPNLNVTESDARDMAEFLYSLD